MSKYDKSKGAKQRVTTIEALALFGSVLCIQFWEIWRAGGYLDRAEDWLDNGSYVTIASIIGSGHFNAPYEESHFLGFPLLIEGVSRLFRIPEMVSLLTLSVACSLVACFLICRLFGPPVAVAFCILSIDWVRLSVMGGSEPLFACFLFGSFMAARAERWIGAASLASLGSTVRPIGGLALVAFAGVLLYQRRWAKLAAVIITGMVLLSLEGGLTYHLFGDPFISIRLYGSDWGNGWLISFPLFTLFLSILSYAHTVPWTGWLYNLLSIALTLGLTAFIALGRKWRQLFNNIPAEMVFGSLYLAFFFLTNFGQVAQWFPRFMIPILPLGLFYVRSWIPQNPGIVWPAAAASALLAAAGIVGFKTVFGFGLR